MESRTPQKPFRSPLPPLRTPQKPLGEFRRRTKRLFFGLEVPRPLRSQLTELDPKIRNVRWVREEQIHLTLSFLGDVTPDREGELDEAVSRIQVGSFFLPVRDMGLLGGRRPNVLWVGVGNGHPHLFALYKHLQDAVVNLGFQADLRAYQPHITLARMEGVSAETLQPFVRQHANDDFGMWPVRDFVLYSSQRAPSGTTYRVEARYPLKISAGRDDLEAQNAAL
ncbi:MAG: RNA 2',3'-cyclic phosphodiesterase [Chthoniobacterales bacterium]